MIGDGFLRYLSTAHSHFNELYMAQEPNNEVKAETVISLIKRLKEMLTVDSDGKIILNYFGPMLKNLFKTDCPEKLSFQEGIQMAYKFVREENNKLMACNDAKLAPRYSALRKYMESRLPDLGIEVIKD